MTIGWEENKNIIFADGKHIKDMFGKRKNKAKAKHEVVEVLYTTFKKHKPTRVGTQTIVYVDNNHRRRTKTIVHHIYESNL